MLKQTETDEIKPAWTPATQVPATQQDLTIAPLQTELKSLARKFEGNSATVRAEAEQQLRKMDVPTLLALMDFQRQMRKKKLLGIGAIGALFFILGPFLAFWMHSPMIFMYLMPIFGGLIGAVAFTPMQKSAAMALAQTDDLDAVGELAAALEMRDEAVQRVVRQALTNLLPRLRSNDAQLLNASQRRVLRLFMEDMLFGRRFRKFPAQAEEVPLRLAVLKALEQVGDASFLPVVKQWAEGRKYGADPRIRHAAEECLAYLEQSNFQSQASKELLRASTEDRSLDGQALLRPAAGTTPPIAEELLRPSNPD